VTKAAQLRIFIGIGFALGAVVALLAYDCRAPPARPSYERGKIAAVARSSRNVNSRRGGPISFKPLHSRIGPVLLGGRVISLDRLIRRDLCSADCQFRAVKIFCNHMALAIYCGAIVLRLLPAPP
jgi:hypothetical protein